MFEYETSEKPKVAESLPKDIEERFANTARLIEACSLFQWEEHCTECAMPACFSTCDLYKARKDGKCRRFYNGFEKIKVEDQEISQVAKVSFKRWGSVMATGTADIVSSSKANETAKGSERLDQIASAIPDGNISIMGRKGLSSRLARRIKTATIARAVDSESLESLPDVFLAEIYNPSPDAYHITLTIRSQGRKKIFPFQELMIIKPGYNCFHIDYQAIIDHIDEDQKFWISISPNILSEEEEGLVLYFGNLSFVKLKEQSSYNAEQLTPYFPGILPNGEKHVKVVAWDLDNTLWEGILLENKSDAIKLKSRAKEVIMELDRRGIINSVVSKNDESIVNPVLEKLGLSEYILFPKVSWQPKSQSIAEIAADMNIGQNTIAVLDDSPFEREEIKTQCPEVRVYNEDMYLEILYLPEFRPPLSKESEKRRSFYRSEERRSKTVKLYEGDYEEFLIDCEIHMFIDLVDQENVDRAHELIQRTNQMNFSTNRYSRSDLNLILESDHYLPISISCYDKFGEYGVVGFCLFDVDQSRVKDLMFSCRVQAKHVEHAFFRRLAKFEKGRGGSFINVDYKRTDRNSQAANVFDDLGFKCHTICSEEKLYCYRLDLSDFSTDERVINVQWRVTNEDV